MAGSRRPPSRAGFSLIEVLALIVLFTLTVTLLLPAVGRARRASRMVACTNNLRQITLAATNYEGLHGTFPPGALPRDDGGVPLSWLARMLPQLDNFAMVRSMDLSAGYDDPANALVASTRVTILLCPADPRGGASYAGVRHHRDAPPAPTDTGLLPVGPPVPATAATDGLSNTLLCGEKRSVTAPGAWAAGDVRTLRTGHAPPGADPVRGFAGHHGGGALFALGDGAVRWVPDATDAGVFARLCHRCDGGLPVRWDPMR